MIKVRFYNRREIRMGSPYNLCRMKLEGDWVPDLPKDDWQDLSALSPDGRYLVLVRWDTADNVPGFVLYLIDTRKQEYKISPRILGICTGLEWKGDEIHYRTWSVHGESGSYLPMPE